MALGDRRRGRRWFVPPAVRLRRPTGGGTIERLENRQLLAALPEALFTDSLTAPAAGQWVDFGASGATGWEVLDEGADGTFAAVVRSPGAWWLPIEEAGRTYGGLSIDGAALSGEPGQPGLPVFRKLISVPSGATITAHAAGERQVYSLGELGKFDAIAPAQPAAAKVEGSADPELYIDAGAYSADSFEPTAQVRLVEAGQSAGQRLVLIEVSPIRYNPAKSSVEVYPELSIELEYAGAAGGATLAPADVAQRLLVVVPAAFAGSGEVDRFVGHKQAMGWVMGRIDCPAGATNVQIKSMIAAQYADPLLRPDALLLVGDTNLVPHFSGAGSDAPDSDVYYACMDAGDDWAPEFAVGRFSARTEAQLAAMIDKSIEYETSAAGDWVRKAAFIAGSDRYYITESTHNAVIAAHMDRLGYASDRLYTRTYSATTAQVTAAFNDGRVLAAYSGHGAANRWSDGPSFDQGNINALSNLGEYPLVFSFACDTGDYSLDESFAETWQRAAGKGAVAVLAASVDSYWTEDDVFEKRVFQAIFGEGVARIGDAVRRAKQLYLEHFGVSSMTRRYFEMYNLFGDPTLEMAGQEVRIASPADLPPAYVGEATEAALSASGGAAPYAWSVVGGELPEGLALGADGRITGTPAREGAWSFTARVTDFRGDSDERELRLAVTTRLRSTTAAVLPAGSIGSPYSASLSATGGTGPYTWSVDAAGRFEMSAGAGGWLGGGTPMGWRGDDVAWSIDLPWAFPFYGRSYTKAYISSNGFIDFASAATDYANSSQSLAGNPRIAAMWDDLTLNAAGDNVFITQAEDYVAIRWLAHTFTSSEAMNVEAVLFRDGNIRFDYGSTMPGLTPTIGISAGDGARMMLAALDGAATIAGDQHVLFTYVAPLPAGLALDPAGVISGTPSRTGRYDLELTVRDSSGSPQSITVPLGLMIYELPPITLELPASAREGDGVLAQAGRVVLPQAAETDISVSLQCSIAGEIALPAAVVVPAGEREARFDVEALDDELLDGTREATVIASAAGYTAASAVMAVRDDETASLALSLPAVVREGDALPPGSGRVTSSTAPAADIEIALWVSRPDQLQAPATVTLRAGETSALFDLAAIDDVLIDGDWDVELAARADGWAAAAAAIRVEDDDRVLSLSIPARISEGAGSAAGKVSLPSAAPADLVVTLRSLSADVDAPATVTIPAGAAEAQFALSVRDDGLFDGVSEAVIEAEAEAYAGDAASTTIEDDEVHHFGFEPIDPQRQAGVAFPMTITARDVNDSTITFYDGVVELTASSGGAPAPLRVVSDPIVSKGAWTTATLAAEGPAALPAKGFEGYHTYESLTDDLVALVAAHPQIAQLHTIGQSAEGRELWAVKITDRVGEEEDEPELAWFSTLHGDESLGTEMCLYLIDHLLGQYGEDAAITALVDETETWIVPLANPDGLAAGTRENAWGIDLNRNFPEGSLAPLGNVVEGPAMDLAWRAPETAALMSFSAAHRFVLGANLHTGSLVVNYPYDNDGLGSVDSPSPDDALFRHIAEVYASRNLPMWNSTQFFHGITNGAAWYSVSGGMQDWSYRYLGGNHVTIELSDVEKPADADVPFSWSDNRAAMLAFMQSAHMGVRGVVTDAVTGAPISAGVRLAGSQQSVFTDPDVGDYHQMLVPGTYDLVFWAPGYDPVTVRNVAVAEGQTARVDVSLPPQGMLAFHGGAWTGTVAVDGLVDGVILAARDLRSGQAGTSAAFDVVAGALDHFEFSDIESPQIAGLAVPLTVTARDANGYLVAGFEGPLPIQAYGDAEPLTIGEGTEAWDYPLASFYEDARAQVIYLAQDLGGPARIRSLSLNVQSPPGQALENWTIRLKHTSLGSYGVDDGWESDGWTRVFRGRAEISQGGWATFLFDRPFDYSGTSNLMVDFSFNGSSLSFDGFVVATGAAGYRSLAFQSDSEHGDPLGWGPEGGPEPDRFAIAPDVRLGVAMPVAAICDPQPVFVEGAWSGTARIDAVAGGVQLSVGDPGSPGGGSARFDVEANAAPFVPPLPPADAMEGVEFALAGLFDDANVHDGWTATVRWGDGLAPEPLVLGPDRTFVLRHTYEAYGAYTGTVTVTDRLGLEASADFTVTVRHAHAMAGVDGPETIVLRLEGGVLQAHRTASPQGDGDYSIPLALLDSLALTGLEAEDLVIVDAAGGTPVPAGGLWLAGSGQVVLSGDGLAAVIDGREVTFNGQAVHLGEGQSLRIEGGDGADVVRVQSPALVPAFNGRGGEDELRLGPGAYEFGGDLGQKTAALRLVVEGEVALNASQHLEMLSIGVGARVTLGGTQRLISAATLAIGDGGWLDLGVNVLAVRGDESKRDGLVALVTGLVARARGSAKASASGGITSASADLTHDLAVLWNAGGSGPIVPAVGEEALPAECVLAAWGLVGDVDLSGVVDGDDYFAIDAGFLAALPAGATYAGGDFNYDQVIDGEDYHAIDGVFLRLRAAAPAAAANAAKSGDEPVERPDFYIVLAPTHVA